MSGKGLFNPSTIAILGARDEPSDAANLYRSIRASGFDGEIVLVNPNHAELFGQTCLPSLEAAEGEIDLAIILVGSEAATESAVSDSVHKGAKLIQIYGSVGPRAIFGPPDTEMRPRILGPSSLGFFNAPAPLSTLVIHPQNLPIVSGGNIRITGQSGGLLLAAAEYGQLIGLSPELIVSTGTEMDLSALEIAIDALSEPDLGAVGLILEGVGSANAFRELLEKAASSPVPVVTLKLGRSEQGAAHATTHSQSVAGPGDVFDDLCRQHGVLVTRSIRDFAEVLKLFQAGFGQTPEGIAFLGLSGGLRVLISDVADSVGLEIGPFDEAIVTSLEEVLGHSGAANPVDLGAIALQDPSLVGKAAKILMGDDAIGVLALVTHLRATGGSPAYRSLIAEFVALAETARRHGKRLVVIGTSPSGIGGANWQSCVNAGVPVLSDISSIGNLSNVWSHGRVPSIAKDRTETSTGALLRRSEFNVATSDLLDSLSRDGVRLAAWRIASGRENVVEAAIEIGFPVALKIISPELLHKTDIGGVILGIEDEETLVAEFDRLSATAARHGYGPFGKVMIQEMVPGEVELMVGTSLQPEFGRIVTLAIGGIHVEFVDDAVHAFAPFDESYAVRMLASLRSQHLLDGGRGGTAVNLGRITNYLASFSRVCADLPEWVLSLELNPVICTPDDPIGVDVAMFVETEE